jgi:hypothetical protein
MVPVEDDEKEEFLSQGSQGEEEEEKKTEGWTGPESKE